LPPFALARCSTRPQQRAAPTGEAATERIALPFPNFRPSRISEFENRIEYPPPGSELHAQA